MVNEKRSGSRTKEEEVVGMGQLVIQNSQGESSSENLDIKIFRSGRRKRTSKYETSRRINLP